MQSDNYYWSLNSLFGEIKKNYTAIVLLKLSREYRERSYNNI